MENISVAFYSIPNSIANEIPISSPIVTRCFPLLGDGSMMHIGSFAQIIVIQMPKDNS